MNLTAPKFDNHELVLLKKCLDSGWVTQGPLTQEFENLFSQKHKVGFSLSTTSCTAALHMSTMALGLGPGDEVIVPAFTWVTSAHSVEYVGAKVVFADVDPDTFNIDPMSFESSITQNTRGVVVVHLFGLPAKMDKIMDIARRHNLFVIEDAACAVGSAYNGVPVGSFGDFGCFSFHPRKVITTGEGGMVTTNKKELAEVVKSLRNHGATGHLKKDDGLPKPYKMGTFDVLGYNLRLSDIQAAVGIAQMAKLDELLRERRILAERYNKLLENIEQIKIPNVPPKCLHTYQSYVIRVLRGGMLNRNEIMDYLYLFDIQTRPGTHAVHRLGYYVDKYGLKPGQFPAASNCEDTTITLPLFPGMTEEQQTFVVSKLKEAINDKKI